MKKVDDRYNDSNERLRAMANGINLLKSKYASYQGDIDTMVVEFEKEPQSNSVYSRFFREKKPEKNLAVQSLENDLYKAYTGFEIGDGASQKALGARLRAWFKTDPQELIKTALEMYSNLNSSVKEGLNFGGAGAGVSAVNNPEAVLNRIDWFIKNLENGSWTVP